ncbi:MAG: TolC family protein, partial [Nitrospinaceae bacterium]
LAAKLIQDNQDGLKNIMNVPFDSPEGMKEVVPLDTPRFTGGPKMDLAETIREALDHRPDYLSRKKELGNRNIQVQFNENQIYPSLDLVGTFGLNGLSGTAIPIQRFGAGTVQSRFGGNYGKSLEDTFSGNFKSWEVGLLLKYPLGNRAAKSRLSASRLEAAQLLLDLKNLEKSIVLEVRETLRQITTDVKRIQAARISRQLALEKLKAEEKKFAVGLSTSFNVLEFQTDLAEEESKELKAITDFKKSLNTMRKVTASTLKTYNIHLADRSRQP